MERIAFVDLYQQFYCKKYLVLSSKLKNKKPKQQQTNKENTCNLLNLILIFLSWLLNALLSQVALVSQAALVLPIFFLCHQ